MRNFAAGMKKWSIIGLLLCLLATACRQRENVDVENAVYYWRTEWRLDSVEKAFLHQYNINKVYCRYFDVVMRDGQPMPNATVTFTDHLPDGVAFVPTVYITENCMRDSIVGNGDELASKLVARVVQMNETNDIHGIEELQIDCDYTERSRHTYYSFLEAVRCEAATRGMYLSTTIRLHQLAMPVPPVDYGVLMIYNTGDPRKFETRNPVLDERDVRPYLRYLADYPLRLSAAYPVYRWQRNIHGVRVEHVVEADEILRVKAIVEKRRHELRNSIVVYHLNNENINRYTTETNEAIYHH